MSVAALPTDFSDADYRLFQQKVQARTGVRLSDYKSDQMRRRIVTMSQQAGCHSFLTYWGVIERDALARAGFLDKMTINVTELLRNPERFEDLSRLILPDLLARRPGGALSVWSAGCSYGAEAFTVAMLLREVSPGPAHRIWGTDINAAMVAKTEAPEFTEADMANISPARRQAFFPCDSLGLYRPVPALRAMTRFGRHDLLSGSYPRGEYDIILCRNVLIYFTDEAKERLSRGFLQALRPGGVLFVGGTERLSDHRAAGFELLCPFFYRRPG